MASVAKEILELITALQGLRLSGYVDTGGFALLVYDYMLTFEDERTLIWPKKWSLIKFLFLVARYLPFIDLSITTSHHFRKNMTPEACWLAYQSAGWLINIGILLSEFILIIRTWAVWERTRFVALTLASWAVVNLVADFIVMGLFMTSIKFSSLPIGLSGCLVTSGNALIIGVWIILMVFEAGIITMMAYKGFQMYTQLGSSALYLVVFRDGAIFYIYIFTLSVANVIVISRLSRDLSTMLASIERVTHAILVQRLLLTLHSTASGSEQVDATQLESMKFGSGPQAISAMDKEVRTGPILSSASSS